MATVSSSCQVLSFGVTGCDCVTSYVWFGEAVTLKVAMNVVQLGMLESPLNYVKIGV